MLAIAQTETDDLDRGATSVAAGGERFCALTREVKPVAELMRFVVGPAGEAVPDLKRKLPGRGLWITATREAIEDAVKRNVFARSFKREMKVSRELAAEVERLLAKSALDALSIAGKAGNVVAGFAKVQSVMTEGHVLGLIHAAEAAPDGKRKLNSALQRNNQSQNREIPLIETFPGADLDLALNRPNVVHAAVLAGPASETFLARVARLMRYRSGNSPDSISAAAP
ncbi:RNA-binding protein [Undibacter mobilis]|uniref:RNA-binding protein n=1 Tax=Undibacter mobilis TaxID=2292256 RepID=A0A371B996_9BRAD|nr:RNA-binding protein [Undibacter mobilis]RDV03951.1 RNA-binding protein [Undibacter mobilis]